MIWLSIQGFSKRRYTAYRNAQKEKKKINPQGEEKVWFSVHSSNTGHSPLGTENHTRHRLEDLNLLKPKTYIMYHQL